MLSSEAYETESSTFSVGSDRASEESQHPALDGYRCDRKRRVPELGRVLRFFGVTAASSQFYATREVCDAVGRVSGSMIAKTLFLVKIIHRIGA
jgi:hypothetical protein